MLRTAVALSCTLGVWGASSSEVGPPLAGGACASTSGEPDSSALLQNSGLLKTRRQSSSKKAQRLRISKVHGSGARSGGSSERVEVMSYLQGFTLLVNISLGSDPRELPVQIDLGSGPLWAATTRAECCHLDGACTACQKEGRPGHDFSGARPLSQFFTTYGAGNVTGTAYVENVTIGDLPDFPVVMAAGDLLFQTTGFYNSPMEGLMGLGLAYTCEGTTYVLNEDGTKSWATKYEAWNIVYNMSTVLMMWHHRAIDTPVFTLALSEEGGVLTLGEIDSSQIDGEFFWTPAVRPMSPDAGGLTPSGQPLFGFWSFSIDAFTIGDTQLHRTGLGILDSGFSGVGVQTDIYAQWLDLARLSAGSDIRQVPAFGGQLTVVVAPCSDLGKLPSVSFTVAGQTWALDVSELSVSDPVIPDISQSDFPPGSCAVMLIGGVVAQGYEVILGTPFLEKYVTAFDATPDMERLAIANKNNENTSEPSPSPAQAS